MITKKLLLAFFTLLFSFTALAQGFQDFDQAPANYFNGAYIGLGIGASYIHGSGKVNGIDHTSTGNVPYSLSKNISNTGVASQATIGYGSVVSQNFYLGAEFYLRFAQNSYKYKMSALPYDTSLSGSSTVAAAIALRAGMLINPRVLAYISAAADLGNLDIKAKHVQTLDLYDTYLTITPGVGLEAMLSNNLSLRAQYDIYLFGSKNKSTIVRLYNNTPLRTLNGKVSDLIRHLFLISVFYHFN